MDASKIMKPFEIDVLYLSVSGHKALDEAFAVIKSMLFDI